MPIFVESPPTLVFSNPDRERYTIGFDEEGHLFVQHNGVKSYVVLSLTIPDGEGRITPPTYGTTTPSQAVPLTLGEIKTIWDYLKESEEL